MKLILRTSMLLAAAALYSPVYAQICKNSIIASATPAFFEPIQPHTLLDKRTSIIWSRCALGQHWNNQQCIGSGKTLSFAAARQAARNWSKQEKQVWRLPTVAELSLLVELRCHSPAIDLTLFPNTPSGSFWTSTRFVNKLNHHWQVQFEFGANHANKDSSLANIRLVRDQI